MLTTSRPLTHTRTLLVLHHAAHDLEYLRAKENISQSTDTDGKMKEHVEKDDLLEYLDDVLKVDP